MQVKPIKFQGQLNNNQQPIISSGRSSISRANAGGVQSL